MAIREKVWKCSDCESDGILGRHKTCPQCGSPREKGEMRSLTGQGTSKPAVTDPDLLGLARAGADWFCTHCTAGNIGDGRACSKCGAPRYATAEENHPNFPTDHVRAPTGGIPEQEVRSTPVDPPPPPPQQPPPPDDAREPLINVRAPLPWGFLAALLGGILLCGFLVWATQTHEVQGHVSSMSWTRTVHIETWTDITVRQFKKDTIERAGIPPSRGSGEQAGIVLVGGCRNEYYETVRVQCGSHQECEDIYRTEQESYSCSKPGPDVACGETCTDLGNGFEDCNTKWCSGPDVQSTCYRDRRVFDHEECRDVIDYCDERRDALKCDYVTQEWQTHRDYTTSDFGKDLRWEEVHVGPLQRATYSATTRLAIYYVDGRRPEMKEYLTSVSRVSKMEAEASAKEYLTWTMGQIVFLDVNNLGGVSGVPRRGSAQ